MDRNDSSSDYTSGISADSWRSSGSWSDKGSYDTQWDMGDLADYNIYSIRLNGCIQLSFISSILNVIMGMDNANLNWLKFHGM